MKIEYVNILAVPKSDKQKIKFAVSNNEGFYELKLKRFTSYDITISHLGFEKQVIPLSIEDIDITKDIILQSAKEELGKVTITYTPPIVFKKDTITYNTESFTTGEERKLRDVLKKLPGVEIDREGNVTVQGKKITKVLVENKEFFTGDSKLAVNNIPADAVNKIQMLDNYNEVGFLKNLEDTDEMAMNIKLKENKKKFVFGDIEVGGGIEERYIVHPSLYYYSPKTTFNAIGDFNNIGAKSFTVKDYVNFEGGSRNFLDNREAYFDIVNDEFSRFLTNRNYNENNNNFGALSFTHELNPKTEISSYVIFSGVKNGTREEAINDYTTNFNFTENRLVTGSQKINFGIGKIKLRSKADEDTDLRMNLFVKRYNYDIIQDIITTSTETNSIESLFDNTTTSITQDIQWDKQFSKSHTLSVFGEYQYQKGRSDTNWLTDQAIFQSILPLIQNDEYFIIKNKLAVANKFTSAIKHYWVLNRLNHIYTTFGIDLSFDSYDTSESQELNNGTINSFESAGFGNDTNLQVGNLYFGMHYKFQKGKFTIKPSIFYHTYFWNYDQINENTTRNTEYLLLPQLTADLALSKSKKISFRYNYKTRFPNITQFANRLTLLNFNNVYQGNTQLANERFHDSRIRYSHFNLFKDMYYSLLLNYRKKDDNIKNTTLLQGINAISTPLLSDFEDTTLNVGGSITKGLSDIKLSLTASATIVDYDAPINNEVISNNSKNFRLGGGFETRFKNFPNIEINYSKIISKYKNITTNQFNQDLLSVFIEYDFLKSFIFKADYTYEEYKNKGLNTINDFNIANFSLFYQKENSAWGFEISANNVFDIKFRQRNSFSSIVVSDERTFILPRIILLKLIYKL